MNLSPIPNAYDIELFPLDAVEQFRKNNETSEDSWHDFVMEEKMLCGHVCTECDRLWLSAGENRYYPYRELDDKPLDDVDLDGEKLAMATDIDISAVYSEPSLLHTNPNLWTTVTLNGKRTVVRTQLHDTIRWYSAENHEGFDISAVKDEDIRKDSWISRICRSLVSKVKR